MKKSLVSVPDRSVKIPCLDDPWFAPRARRPPTRTVICGAVSFSRLARSSSRVSGDSGSFARRELRNPSPTGSSTSKVSTSVCSCDASVRPGANGTVTLCPAFLAALLDRGASAQNDQVGQGGLLAARLRLVEVLLNPLESLQHG